MEVYHLLENIGPNVSRFYKITINKTDIKPSQVFELFMAYAEKIKMTPKKEYDEECVLFEYNILQKINFRNKIETVMQQENKECPFIELEIFSRNNNGRKKETKVLAFRRDNVNCISSELKKIKIEIKSDPNDTKCNKKLEKDIIQASDSFIKKWKINSGTINSLSMSIEMENIENISGPFNTYSLFYKDYVKPLRSLIDHVKKENYNKIKDNIIVKCIVNKDIDNLLLCLTEKNVNEPINDMGTTLLMFANMNELYHTRIIEILCIYKANKKAIDKNGLGYEDYAEKGHYLFSID